MTEKTLKVIITEDTIPDEEAPKPDTESLSRQMEHKTETKSETTTKPKTN